MIKRAWYLPGNRPRVPWGTHMNFPLKKNLFIYLFIIFGSSRSSLLHTEFLQLQQAGTPFHLWGTGFSLRWHLLLWTSGSRCTGLIVPWCVESSQTRGRTHVPCMGRQIPSHWTAKEVWVSHFCKVTCGSRCGISVVGRSLFSEKIAPASKREKGLTEKVWVGGGEGVERRREGWRWLERRRKRKKDKRKGRSGEGGGGGA